LIDISLTISPVKDAEGAIVGASKIARDITESRRLQAQMARANRDLEQFAFSASHDLQEPLRSIKVYSELLTKRYSDKLDGEALEYLGYLSSGARRMEALVRDLLTYTQVTKIDTSEEIADANQALAFALENLSNTIAESGAAVTTSPLPCVSMHAMHLQQLFQNLIGNGIKYCSPERPPVIHVAAERLNEVSVFAITDNGIGIANQYLEKIFGLFKRLHTDEEYSGTGIGLAICKRIVEQYSGRIWVESRVGQGSTFRFTVPQPRSLGR
jgi:light-regulated signal transduction histidine kinase (bacteriophytochrome)